MTGWVILVDQPKDFANADTPHKVIMTSEYLARPKLFDFGRPKLVNLSRSYAYQSKGYYASLLAEARGHRVVPTVETMLELREAKLYEHALPELEDLLNRCARRAAFQRQSLHHHSSREWRDPKARTVAKYDLAVLYDPNEKLPPSSAATIKHFARIAERLSIDVEPITRRQL